MIRPVNSSGLLLLLLLLCYYFVIIHFFVFTVNVRRWCGSYFDGDGCWRHRSVLGNVGPLHRRRGSCSSHVLKQKDTQTDRQTHTGQGCHTPKTNKSDTHRCRLPEAAPQAPPCSSTLIGACCADSAHPRTRPVHLPSSNFLQLHPATSARVM